jgi:diaminopimelate decarboxylase
VNLPSHLGVRDGHLTIGGLDCLPLAERFGTPLYVTDQDRIVTQFRRYREALTSRYPRVQVLYAAKANGNLAILKALAGEGAGADVFSSGELHLALTAGMPPEKLLFNGSSKSQRDLRLAVEKDITVSVDSLDELHQLDLAARSMGKTAKIAFRVNPALDIPTHPKIATGLATSKFGIAHHLIPGAYKEALRCTHIQPVGLHCHIGSQILDLEPFRKAAGVMMRIAADLVAMGIELEFIDLGGGLGIPYRHGTEVAPTPDEYASVVVPVVNSGVEALGITPELWIEPGRTLVADSTILLSRVNSVKKAHKNFVNVDAGFNLLIRPAMYDSYHEVVSAQNMDHIPEETYTITGPICETGDILASDRCLPLLKAGDLIAILDTGAYGFAMSSQYNSRPRCAEVLIHEGVPALMRRAETIDDITATMRAPPWQS